MVVYQLWVFVLFCFFLFTMKGSTEKALPKAEDFVTSDVDSIPLLIDMLILEKQTPLVEADSVSRETLEKSVCFFLSILFYG